MNRLKTTLMFVLLVAVLATIAVAQRVYTYQCPKCGMTLQYSMPGYYRCPSDGMTLNLR